MSSPYPREGSLSVSLYILFNEAQLRGTLSQEALLIYQAALQKILVPSIQRLNL